MTEVWYVLGGGWMCLNLNLLVYPRGRENDCSHDFHACDDITAQFRLKEMIDTRVGEIPWCFTVARLALFQH